MTTERSDLSRAWEYHNSADQLFAARFNYGMVAQSMLLVSFATLFSSQWRAHVATVFAELAIVTFGLWLSWNQHLLSRSLRSKMHLLRSTYLMKDEVYRAYFEAQPGRPGGIQTTRIPIALGLVWASIGVAAVLAIWRP